MRRKALCGWRTVGVVPGPAGGRVLLQVRARAWGRGELQAREVCESADRILTVRAAGPASGFVWAASSTGAEVHS